MMMRVRLLAIIVPVILAGCGGAAPTPPDNYYRVDVPAPHVEAAPLLPGIVLVHPLTGAGLLQERPILFTAAGQLHQMRQHDYHYWNEAPPRMLQSALIGYLRAGRIAESVVTPDLRITADFEVIGKVKRLEQVLSRPNHVLVELELAVIDTETAQIVTAQTYTAQAKSSESDVEAAVIALNRALADLFADFVADLRNGGRRTLEAEGS